MSLYRKTPHLLNLQKYLIKYTYFIKCFLDIIKTHKSYINYFCCSIAQSCVILRPHGLQHARLSCPSLSPRICSNSCPLSWCAIQSSCPLLPPSPALNLSQNQGLLQYVGSLHQVAKVLELQLQHQSFQWIFTVDFLQDWLLWPPCCPRDFLESSPAPQFKSISPSVISLIYGQNY